MIVSISGYGYSGSGAVLDYLKQFEKIVVVEGIELSFLSDPHGIADLENALVLNFTKHGSDAAIKNFLKNLKLYSDRFGIFRKYNKIFKGKFFTLGKQYIDSLIDISWEGTWDYDILVTPKIKQIIKYRILPRINFFKIKCTSQMYLSYPRDNFYKKTREYTRNLFSQICNIDDNILVVDQLIPPINPLKYMNYIDNCKCIIVDRDPRDIYLLNENVNKASFIPSNNINKFIKWYRTLRMASRQYYEDHNVLRIKFEDMIYNYEKTTELINKFLGLTPTLCKNSKKIFDPRVSINNTQLKLRFKDRQKEIELIEKELVEFLYNFPEIKISDQRNPF